MPPQQGEPREEAQRRAPLSSPPLGAPRAGRGIKVGTCSWADRTLTRESDFYPKKTMRAADRLAHYASVFPIVEVDAGYYYPPTEEQAGLWVNRTPAGFTICVKAYSLLTGHPTRPDSLWPDVGDALPMEHRGKRSVYLTHLPEGALDTAWELFRGALMPLHSAGRLGTVLFQYPHWFRPRPASREALAELPGRLPDYDIAVEFCHGSWLADDERDRTLGLLEQLGLSYVCVDEPQGFSSSVPPVIAGTADIAVVRFHGRSTGAWDGPEVTTAAERFAYRYTTEELCEWVPRLRHLAEGSRETHVLMNNCYRDHAVVNGQMLAALLGAGLQPDTMAKVP